MYLCGSEVVFAGRVEKAILVHDPIGFGAFGGFANVENEGFFYANFSTFGGDDLVGSGGFPITRPSYSVGSRPVRVFPVSGAEKVPLFFTENRFTCKINQSNLFNLEQSN